MIEQLGSGARERAALAEEHGKLIHRYVPIVGWPQRLGQHVADGQPEQLGGCLVGGEVTTRLDDLAQLHVQALNGVGRVAHASDVGWEDVERHHVLPRRSPGPRDRGVFPAPWAEREGLQHLGGGLGAGRRVDRPQRPGERLAVFVPCIVEADADQVHDAGLHRRLGINGRDRVSGISIIPTWGAAKNLDWLSGDPQGPAVPGGAEAAG